MTRMNILGIETSCDDTAAAVYEGDGSEGHMLSTAAHSQGALHRQWGGVYPTAAKRAHSHNLTPVIKQALKEAGLLKTRPQENEQQELAGLDRHPELAVALGEFVRTHTTRRATLDALAVTAGPGLEPCLWTGINGAAALARAWEIPLVPVNHLEGHIWSSFFDSDKHIAIDTAMLPAIALVVSGGTTQLICMHDKGAYTLLGTTRDDAAGECLDKTARILGLPYPGGPAISQRATEWREQDENGRMQIELPRPMINSGDYDVSFSGLKTAVLYDYQGREEKERESTEYITAMAHEIQEAVTDVLVTKTIRAAQEYGANSILLSGGVAANNRLHARLTEEATAVVPEIAVLTPPKELCTDNAAMIAAVGAWHFSQGRTIAPQYITAQPRLTLFS